MPGAKFGLEPGEVSVSFPVAALLDTRSRAPLPSPLLPQTHKASALPTGGFWGGRERAGAYLTLSPVTPHSCSRLPHGLRSQPAAGNAEEPNAEKKKGRSATFYPLDNTPFLLPVDETQPPALNSSMEPVGVSTEMALLSNILAAYAFITENPERAALYFVSGVCIGLVLTLLALVLRVSCRTDCKHSSAKKPPRERESDSDSSDSDDDSDTTSDLSARRHRRFERTLNMNVFTSAEELERAQRLEERERIIREIWMNGQPDIPGTRSLNCYY
ncbi:protein eva-1 homolog A isoform X5 [Aquila chrysaetos chrysaetos]|uniref:protein eva-1 homolog A isoform X5 n=1 Tax=Aquila chrysaetos chrysaetos TaxID=223781 RepID=UPI001176AF8E|nr:protein eva-1 homolog A isoform X5 [Aquila chrysaetos chrysaetos]